MNQFKQIIGMLPRHVSPSSVRATTSSGCQTENLLRSRCGYRSPRYARKQQSAAFTECRRSDRSSKINDDEVQSFLYGNPKLALFHNRNSTMDRAGNLDFSFQDLSSTNYDVNTRVPRKTFKTNAYKDTKVQPKLASAPAAPRTYAEIISDYSESIEERKKSSKVKEQPKGFFSKIPFESVINSLPKLNRNKSQINSTDKRQAKSNQAVADDNVITEKRKISPSIKKTVKSEKTVKTEKSKELVDKVLESRSRKPNSGTVVINNLKTDLDFIYGTKEIENEKENFAVKWIRPKRNRQRVRTAIVDTSVSESKTEGKKVENVAASDQKIGVRTPRTAEEQDMNSKILSLQILDKLKRKPQENLKPVQSEAYNRAKIHYAKTSTSGIPKAAKDSENDKKSPPKSTDAKTADKPKDAQDTKVKRPQNSKALPWWASPECEKKKEAKVTAKPGTCLNDVYAKPETEVKVLGSEEISPVDTPEIKKKPPKSSEQLPEAAAAAAGQKLRKRKKTSTIARVTRHIEKELAERKSEVKKKAVTSTDAADVTKAKKADGEKKEAAKTEDNKKSEKESEKPDDKNPKSARPADKKSIAVTNASSAATENPMLIDLKVNVKKEPESKPSIAVLQKSIDSIDEKSKKSEKNPAATDSASKVESVKKVKKENLIDYGLKVKKISDPLKPIDKKEDGTLIDYGLKVPTRKPRLKPETSKTSQLPGVTIVKEIIPKKTTSTPVQKPLSEISPRKHGGIGSRRPSPQRPASKTKSELPLAKSPKLDTIRSNSKPAIKEESKKSKAEDNLAIAADKGSGKGGGGGGTTPPGKFNNSGGGGPPIGKNNKSEGKKSTPCLSWEAVSSNNPMLKTLTMSTLNADEKKPSSGRIKSCNGERSEKELIYSVWLNRFHTRLHQTTIK